MRNLFYRHFSIAPPVEIGLMACSLPERTVAGKLCPSQIPFLLATPALSYRSRYFWRALDYVEQVQPGSCMIPGAAGPKWKFRLDY